MNKQTKPSISSHNYNLELEEKVQLISQAIEENKYIYTTKPYNEDNITKFTGIDIDKSLDIISPTGYVAFLQSCLMDGDFSDLPNEIVKDLCLANKHGIVCFYLTAVLNMLLRDVHDMQDVKMIQGFYDYKTTLFGFSKSMPYTGVHAFSLVNGGVIDACFFQQNIDYPANSPVMIGTVPDDIALYGWSETVMNEQMYIDFFSKKNHKRSIAHLELCHATAYQDYLSHMLSLM